MNFTTKMSILFQAITYTFMALVSFILFKFFLKPYMTYRKYISIKGVHGEFTPVFGLIHHIQKGVKTYGDGLGYFKHLP